MSWGKSGGGTGRGKETAPSFGLKAGWGKPANEERASGLRKPSQVRHPGLGSSSGREVKIGSFWGWGAERICGARAVWFCVFADALSSQLVEMEKWVWRKSRLRCVCMCVCVG